MKNFIASRFWNDQKSTIVDWASIIMLGFFLFMFGNGNYTLFDNSEPHYSRVTQELVQHHDKLTMTFNGADWYVHPPLYFWMLHGLTSVFGWSEFVLRFWEGLFGILGVLVTYQLGKIFFNRRTGLVAAIILASSLYYVVISRLAIFDTILNTFLLLTCYYFLVAIKDPQRRLSAMVLSGLWSGLAVLCKGPIGIVQPAAVFFLYILASRQFSILKDYRLWLGLVVAFCIGAPWFANQLMAHGKAFFDIALKDYTWYRFFDAVEGQGGSKTYYFFVLLGFFPWIMYLPSVIKSAFTKKIWALKHPTDWVTLFSWIFILFSFVFFSMAQTKLPNYIMTIFPFLSLLIAHDILHTHDKPFLGLSSLLFPLTSSFAFFLCLVTTIPAPFTVHQPLLVTFFGILTAGGWLYAMTFLRHRLTAIGIGATTMAIAVFYIVFTILPTYEGYKEPALLVNTIKTTITQPYALVSVKAFSPYMKYYLNRNIPDELTLQAGITTLKSIAKPGEKQLLVLDQSGFLALSATKIHFQIVSKTDHRFLVELL